MSATVIYTPYFYIIQNIQTKIYYAGSRFNKQGCSPSELLTEGGYNTSSAVVRELGYQNFKIVKIREFKTGQEAYNYETKFLIKVDAKNNPNFYNKHNNDFNISGSAHEVSEKTKNKISQSVKAVKKVQCEYCGKVNSPGNHARWHGNMCVNSPNREEALKYRQDSTEALRSKESEAARIKSGKVGKYKRTDEHRKLASENIKSRMDEEYRNNLSRCMKSTLEKLGNPMSRKESRDKVSNSKIGRRKYYDITSSKYVMIFPCDVIEGVHITLEEARDMSL